MKSIQSLIPLCLTMLLVTLSPAISITASPLQYSQEPMQGDITISATTSIIADVVQNIVGDILTVETIIPEGVDPHDYEPTPSALNLINASDHIFWIGGGAEESLEDLLETREGAGTATSLLESLSAPIEANHEEEEEEHGHGAFDPHFWLDPVQMMEVVPVIETILSELMPDTGSFESQAQSYLDELEQVHNSTTVGFEEISENKRYLVTQHDSFAYFGRQYNFTLQSLQGLSTDSEVGIREIDGLATYLVENDIEVVFTEDTGNNDNLEAVIDSARAQGHTVVIGGQLYVGSLSDSSSADTYLNLISYNGDTIRNNILNPPEATDSFLNYTSFALVILLAFPLLRRRVIQ